MSSDKLIKSGRGRWVPAVILLITFCFIAWLAYLNIEVNAIKGDRGPPGKDGLPGPQGPQGPAAQTQTNDSAAFIDTSVQGKISYDFSEVSNTVVFNFINKIGINPGEYFDIATIKIPNFTLPPKNDSIIGTCFANDNDPPGQLEFFAKITAILRAPVDETGVATISIMNTERAYSGASLPAGKYIFGTINWVVL